MIIALIFMRIINFLSWRQFFAVLFVELLAIFYRWGKGQGLDK